MSPEKGRKFLPNIWSIFFKPLEDEGFRVDPWENRELADCAEFQLGTGGSQLDEVTFFVTDEKLIDFLKHASGKLYLFGAYNQIIVCQMRARGVVTFIEGGGPGIDQVKARLRAAIEPRVGSIINKLDDGEAAKRYSILDNGLPFCFRISSYAYHVYERG